LDPYVNAVHGALLRAKDELPPASEERFEALRDKLIRYGPQALSPKEKVGLLLDGDSVRLLHDRVWSAPTEQLAPWWRVAISHYSRVAPLPETAFSRQAA
jgi:membrane glycosyltransferase